MFQKHYRRVLGSCIIFNTPTLFPVGHACEQASCVAPVVVVD